MQIREAKIYNFGKLQNRTFSFEPGINLIYGENEAGKSTLHMFLKSMLFGLEKSRGKKDDYRKYEPWHAPSYYSGALRFEVAGRPFFLERNFYSKEKKEALCNEADGEELSVAYGDLEMLLGNVSKETYENTYDIPQCGVVTDVRMSELLAEYLSDAAGSGNASAKVTKALQALEQKKKEQQAKLKRYRAEKAEHEKQLLLQKELLEKEWRGQQELLRQTKDTAEPALNRGGEPEPALNLGGEPKPALNRSGGTAESSLNRGGASEESRAPGKKKGAVCWRIAAVLLLILNGIFFAFGYRNITVFCISEILLLALWGILECVCRSSGSQGRARGDGNFFGRGEERVSDFFPEEHTKREEEVFSREAAQRQQLQKLRQRLEENVQEKEAHLANLAEELAQLGQTDRTERELLEDVEALELAASQIAHLSEELCEDIKDELEAEISKQISYITEGKYDRITVDANGNLEVYEDGRKISLDQLSRGTYEQFYLAFRLAVGAVVSAEEPLPILLDEVFCMYDEKRLSQALKCLSATGHQILLFTCQQREEDALLRLGIPYHKLCL